MNNPILTISIPTYNRAIYLEKSLHSICKQLTSDIPVIIKVYDNDSIDKTYEVVKSFIDKYSQISYIKNEKNIGPDLNIGQCYYLSKTRYTWVFGDDDILLDGALVHITNILNSDIEYSLVFLNYCIFFDNFELKKQKKSWEKYTYQVDSTSLVSIVGHRLGFISACIINSESITKDEILNNAGTNFNHLYPILNSLKLEYPNLYIGEYYLAQKGGNSESLDFFNVFANNLFNIFIETFGKKHKITKLIKRELLICILPSAIVFARKNLNDSNFKSNSFHVLFNNFSSVPLFWIINYPLMKLPISIAVALKFFFIIVSKVYREINKFIFYIHNYSNRCFSQRI